MSDIAFRQFSYATKLVSAQTLYFNQVREWEAKRQTLIVQLADIPVLTQAHHDRTSHPYDLDPKITIQDMVPTVRLSNACEATANCLYSVAEIAANFANKASKGLIPSSFNAIRKKCEKQPESLIAQTLGDLQWYRKVRELRTEWTHFSSIFIADGDNDQTQIFVRGYRRPSDKEEFTSGSFICTVDEFVQWVKAALLTLDRFAGYLLETHVVPNLPLEESVTNPVRDRNGYPIITPDHRFEVETITVTEFLRRGGITFGS